jgi:hypothetical protein
MVIMVFLLKFMEEDTAMLMSILSFKIMVIFFSIKLNEDKMVSISLIANRRHF